MSSSKIIGNRYEIYEKIGEGGMAIVYKAKCKLLNRFVAIKILKPEFVKDAKFIESFRRESQAAASLSHPNIVNVYDVGLEGKNIHYIVMEYIEGETLNDIIKREGRLSYADTISIGKQIGSALSLAHKNHIIHRDVKPHNILITKDGVAKITDFGIAKAVNTTTIVNSDAVIGSVHYFSPEQARGGYVDEKSDIYSLGIVMYEMVTGQVPFDGDNPVAVAMMHINSDMEPPSKIIPDIPMELEDIIMKAANKYQSNRFTSAKELVNALERLDEFGIGADQTRMKNRFTSFDKAATRVLDKLEGFNIIREGEEEDEPEDDVRMKKKSNQKTGKRKVKINKSKVGAIILGIIAALFLSKGVLSASNMFFSGDEISVPSVVGMDYEEAQQVLEDANLKVKIEEELASSKYDADEVMSQDPEAEAMVKKGFTIKLTLSKGMEDGKIPNLVGKTFEEASILIDNEEFHIGKIDNESSELPTGIIISQTPEAGEAVSKGSKINIVISSGSQTDVISMPDVVGINVDTAKKIIETLGLKMATPEYEYSSKYALNEVMHQNIKAESEVSAGASIGLVVSKGKEPSTGDADSNNSANPTAPAGSVSLTLDYSKAKNEVFTVKVYKMQDNVESVYEKVHNRADKSETISIKGAGQATITVYFDDDMIAERKADFDAGKFTN